MPPTDEAWDSPRAVAEREEEWQRARQNLIAGRRLGNLLLRNGSLDLEYSFWALTAKVLPEMFTRVPASYVVEEIGRDGDVVVSIARVRCPCGSEPLVEILRGVYCYDCGRYYVYWGEHRVWVAFSPKTYPGNLGRQHGPAIKPA